MLGKGKLATAVGQSDHFNGLKPSLALSWFAKMMAGSL